MNVFILKIFYLNCNIIPTSCEHNSIIMSLCFFLPNIPKTIVGWIDIGRTSPKILVLKVSADRPASILAESIFRALSDVPFRFMVGFSGPSRTFSSRNALGFLIAVQTLSFTFVLF